MSDQSLVICPARCDECPGGHNEPHDHRDDCDEECRGMDVENPPPACIPLAEHGVTNAVLEYDIVHYSGTDLIAPLQCVVRDMANRTVQGWEPHGSLVVYSPAGGRFYVMQPIIRRIHWTVTYTLPEKISLAEPVE